MIDREQELESQLDQCESDCEEMTKENATLRARIKALESAQGARVPEGWVLVPKEPTEAMLDAVGMSILSDPRAVDRETWQNMLAAAPPAPSAPSREPMTEAELERILDDMIAARDRTPSILVGSDRKWMARFIAERLTEASRIGVVAVTDEMVERAAKAAVEWEFNFDSEHQLPWRDLHEHERQNWRDQERAALHAALGQEKG